MAKKIEQFFAEIEAVWEAIPGYVKVFLYSTISTVFGLWVAGQLDAKSVIIVVATNLGIYQLPRVVGTQTKKLL